MENRENFIPCKNFGKRCQKVLWRLEDVVLYLGAKGAGEMTSEGSGSKNERTNMDTLKNRHRSSKSQSYEKVLDKNHFCDKISSDRQPQG